MKNILDYEEYFINGLWHVHTIYGDGVNSIAELCHYAIDNGFPLICFSEHVSKVCTYDFSAYIKDIEDAKEIYKQDLIVLSGIEAKVLENGTVDYRDDMTDQSDILFLGEHSFSGEGEKGFDNYVSALRDCLRDPKVQVWAHPFLIPWHKSWNIPYNVFIALVGECWNNKVVVEDNIKYDYLDTFVLFARYAKYMLNGYDIHDISE